MLFSIPILIQERPARTDAGASTPLFIVRPVFHAEPEQKSEKLSRALNKLNANLHDLLRGLGDEQRHDDLAEWTFSPSLHQRTLAVRLNLKSGAPLKTFFLVHYEALDRQICFFPSISDLSFELLPGQKIEERAAEVLNEYLREKEKSDETFSIDSIALAGKARLSAAEVDLTPGAHGRKKKKRMRALLFGGEEKKSGEQELRKVGQPLHQWYPDDLQRALGRDVEVGDLARLFSLKDRRPILLVGPQKVGKTAVIHELAWQISHRKKEKFGRGREIWLLSPMRLISGMSYLGEWENRINAIIDHARDQDHVLYFEDLLGLFTAGVSSASDLNVAQVLKPHLEKRSVRILAEITPESLRVLREKDRSFADLFQIIPLEEPSEAEVWRVLIHLMRELEGGQECAFDLDVLPLVYDLHRRYLRDAAFPGKAAGFLRRLAVRHRNGKVTRNDALEEFSRQTGLRTSFVAETDSTSRQPARAELLRLLGAQLKGQDQALDAFADVLLSFRAGLNDPARPIGTMLLLGPTGVGKTESAKALAQVLFRSDDRLVRFDLNEFVDARSVARLTGTIHEPDGLLTGAVRRQPFSVILFDEIEKAAPEVFDLLLAVLDEGRLSDSLGRVADFTNCIILLSSNLGAREARSRLGFGAAHDIVEDAIYVTAAEKFFRPEFFNRLDRIIPFRSLSEPELDAIAERLLAKIQTRDGLSRRDCTLTLTEAARRRLVELGHHPQLGARALKRTLEREVVQRLAEQIAATPPSLPIVARLDADAGEFSLNVQALGPAEVTVSWARDFLERGAADTAAECTDKFDLFLDRVETQMETLAPAGPIEWNKISPAQAHYYFCREQLTLVQRLLASLRNRPRQLPRQSMRVPKAVPRKFLIRQTVSGDPKARRLRDRVDLQIAMADFNAEEARETSDSPLLHLLRETAFLHGMLTGKTDSHAAVLAFVKPAGKPDHFLLSIWSDFFKSLWGGDSELVQMTFAGRDQFPIAGPYLELFLPQDGGNIMTRDGSGGWAPVSVRIAPARNFEAARLIAKQQTFESMPGPVIARYDKTGAYADYRTGLAVADAAHMSPQDFRALMLSTLPLPPELEVK
jgi:ATP-dependent Clp protease ATP-binding subunit ClpC